MFLKSIEIRGFKSFADKTDLTFKNGVTAVVGPNGSGKSNISDAVRWVLGEQSIKSLRGGKMEDVIFAGTQFRKPVGLAQVSLTLDNSDYELGIEYMDVTISRRLYRSGESEYYINNTQCRLRDIQELFMDTGIGKEGYSIIGQGKIDAILSGKTEERRALLEEAAGIVKFKSRKEEAEKKLGNTDQNLVRINDILGTYEERLEPLRIENEKAKEFISLSEILKTGEISLILHLIDVNVNKAEKQIADIISVEKEIQDIISQKEELKISLTKFNEELDENEIQNSKDKDKYYEYKNKYQSKQSEMDLVKERIENLNSAAARASKEVEDLEQRIIDLISNKNNMDKELNQNKIKQLNINKEISEYEKSIDDLSNDIATSEKNRNLYREEAIELLRKISDAKNTLNITKNNMEVAQRKLEQINSSTENYVNSIKINASTKLALESEVSRINNEIEKGEEEIKNIKKEISKSASELSNNEYSYKQLNNDLNKYEANFTILNNLEKQYEGYSKSVKTLMQHIDNGRVQNGKNNCHVLGNVIMVENKLETAIEIALGGAISDIITKDEEIAKALINYLKINNLGRATFLPLNIIQGKTLTLNDSITKSKGYMGIASDLIEYEEKFSPAIRHVLGRTIIADEMDNALSIAKKSNYSYKIVTLSGEVINPGGALTGGSTYHKSASIIGRKREIEEIESRIKTTKHDVSKLLEVIENSKRFIKELDEKSLNIKDDIHYKHIEITKLKERISAIINDTEKLKHTLEQTQNETADINKAILEFKLKQENKEKDIINLTEQENNNEKSIEAIEQLIIEKQEENEKLKENFMKLKINKAQIDENVHNMHKEFERLIQDLKNSNSQKESFEKELKDSLDSIETNKLIIEENIRLNEELQKEISVLQAGFEKNEYFRLSIKEEIKSVNEKYELVNISLNKKEEEKHKFDIAITKLETEKESLYERLNEEFEVTYAEALKFKRDIEDIEKLKREISTLKGKITLLGVVNLGAIEEYEQTKEKYHFMNLQREDLIKAKDELTNVINELTEKIKELFNENFKKLKENFNETFKELFKGGSADLILAEGDELTAPIDINVQPPGKKLQNINLMSGGEKVLSAIALLFAILKMKPTPFCILDEIEAALDDANVFRYAEFLKKFSKNIQFIVITHRKGTMEASDVLYGVTMQEKGVSKIVSVDLRKAL